MQNEENKVVVAPQSEEKVVEIEDVDVGLKDSDVQAIKKENERRVKEQHVLNKDQQRIFTKILKEAKMPVKIKDSDFKLGENELDIRGLSSANRTQMLFRQFTLMNVYLKQVLTSLIDETRLLMVIADKIGVEDIVASTDDVIEKVEKKEKLKEQLKKATQKDKVAKA